MREKDYSEQPKTLGEHLKKRRRGLRFLQREAARTMGIDLWTYINWEKDRTVPIASRFRPVIDFLGFDPSTRPTTLAERLEAKRRATGMTFAQVAAQLGWDEGTLSRYLRSTRRIPASRLVALEAFLSAVH